MSIPGWGKPPAQNQRYQPVDVSGFLLLSQMGISAYTHRTCINKTITPLLTVRTSI